jgi:hypothetical protein
MRLRTALQLDNHEIPNVLLQNHLNRISPRAKLDEKLVEKLGAGAAAESVPNNEVGAITDAPMQKCERKGTRLLV